jgi:hypothetical protein
MDGTEQTLADYRTLKTLSLALHRFVVEGGRIGQNGSHSIGPHNPSLEISSGFLLGF